MALLGRRQILQCVRISANLLAKHSATQNAVGTVPAPSDGAAGPRSTRCAPDRPAESLRRLRQHMDVRTGVGGLAGIGRFHEWGMRTLKFHAILSSASKTARSLVDPYAPGPVGEEPDRGILRRNRGEEGEPREGVRGVGRGEGGVEPVAQGSTKAIHFALVSRTRSKNYPKLLPGVVRKSRWAAPFPFVWGP